MENNKNQTIINDNNKSISLSDIMRVIKKNWILIIIVTAIVFIFGTSYTYGIAKPKYKATAKIMVKFTDSDRESTISEQSTASSTALRYVTSVAEYVKFEHILSAVEEKNQDIINKGELANEISTSFSSTSIFVYITVKDRNGDNAKKLVNDIVEEVVRYSANSTDLGIDNNDKLDCNLVGYQTLNSSYDSPNKKLFLIVSFLGGLVLSLVIVFIKEFASNKYKTIEEIEMLGFPILNTLVDDKAKNDEYALIEPTIKNYEPYNRLISNIKFANVDKPYKVIMFTSSISNELKTTVCSNFVYTLAHNEKKTLIIDLDTRKPSVHKVFKLERGNGIVEYLDGSITKDQLIKHTDINVDVITVGKDILNPITILESEKLKKLIDELKNDYDFIAIDTPPLGACNDASLVSKFSDAVVFNVAINQGKKKEIAAAINQLNDVGANVIGINVTKVHSTQSFYSYYDYGNRK